MKKLILFACILFSCGYTHSALATSKIAISCHNCSEAQYKHAATALQINGATVIVFDETKQSVRAYRLAKYYIDDGIELYRASALSVSSDLVSAYSSYASSVKEYMEELRKDYGGDTIDFENVSTVSVQKGGTPVQNTISDKPINAYDFMSSSSLRREVFQKLTTQYPTYVKLGGLWNSVVQIVDISFGGKVASINADLSTLAFTPNLQFEDGSFVIAEYNTRTSTFVVLEGVDEAENDIPNKNDSKIDLNYKVISPSHYEDMQQYLGGYWHVDFSGGNGSNTGGQSCSTNCSIISEGHWQCVYSCY